MPMACRIYTSEGGLAAPAMRERWGWAAHSRVCNAVIRVEVFTFTFPSAVNAQSKKFQVEIRCAILRGSTIRSLQTLLLEVP